MIIDTKKILDPNGKEFFRYIAFCYTTGQNNREDHIELEQQLGKLLRSKAPNIAIGLENVDNLIGPTKNIIVKAQKHAIKLIKTYHVITNSTSTMYEEMETLFKERTGKGAFARITETSKVKDFVYIHKGYSSFERTVEDYFKNKETR